MRKKLLNSVKHLSNTHGSWINLRAREKEVSPSIFLFGNLSHQNITSPSLMPLDIEISLKTWSPVLLKLTALFLWLLHLKVNLRLVFLKKVKLENMPSLLSPLVSNKWSFAAIKLMKRVSTILNKDITKSKKKSVNSWKKSDINPKLFNSSQFQDGTETIC